MKTFTRFILLLALAAIAIPALAGSLTPPGLPANGSGMPTTRAIFQQLSSGQVTAIPGTFQEPSAGPTTGTGRSLAEIKAKLPVADNVNGATASDVLSGKTFWGLRTDGTWGVKSGTVAAGANVTGASGSLTVTIPDGLYSGGKSATAVDGNLVSGNIKAGATIFGVIGNTNVVDTTSGSAAANDLQLGKKAWVAGSELSGSRVGGVTLKPGGSFSAEGRWYDNNDGTITDTTTGLVWLKDLSWKGSVAFAYPSGQYCLPFPVGECDSFSLLTSLQNGVGGLSDGSATGDWRMPLLKELQSLMTGVEPVSYAAQQLFVGIVGVGGRYWTTTKSNYQGSVYGVDFSDGGVLVMSLETMSPYKGYLFPVRSGL